MTLHQPVPEVAGTRGGEAPVTGTVPAGRPMIDTLTGLRALASGWVVIYHLKQPVFVFFPVLLPAAPVVANGFLAIEIFFVLSGFVMAYNYAERVKTGPGFRKYLWARVARLYPVHLLMLLVALVAFAVLTRAEFIRLPATEDFPATPVNLLGNVLMLQAVPGFRAFDGPAWSISCEAGAYLLFPLLTWWGLRSSPRVALCAAATVMLLGVLGMNLIDLPDAEWAISHPLMWARIATEFTAGVLLWAWWRAGARGSRRWDVAAVVCVVGTVLFSYLVPPETPLSLVALPVMALFVLCCASVTGPVAKVLASRVMVWLGNLSYSLYMSHWVVYVLVRTLIPWERYAGAPALVRVGWLAVLALWVLGTAVALHYGVEEPGRRWLARHYPGGRRVTRAA